MKQNHNTILYKEFMAHKNRNYVWLKASYRLNTFGNWMTLSKPLSLHTSHNGWKNFWNQNNQNQLRWTNFQKDGPEVLELEVVESLLRVSLSKEAMFGKVLWQNHCQMSPIKTKSDGKYNPNKLWLCYIYKASFSEYGMREEY